MTQPIKVVEATQTHTKVWNVTDWPGKGLRLQSFILFGRTLTPGRSVKVPVEDVETPLLKRMIDQGLLCVGQQAPVEYLSAKGQILARAPREATRTHGDTPELKKRRELRKTGELPTPPTRQESKVQGTQGPFKEGVAAGSKGGEEEATATKKRRSLRDQASKSKE